MNLSRVCRCCLSENCYKDISSEYFYAGQKEVYSDLLFETFSLTISYLEDENRLICEECIEKLRAAAAFRKQVEDTEESICNISRGLQQESVPQPKSDFKELEETSEHDSDFIDHLVDEEFTWQDDQMANDEGNLIIIKLEHEDIQLQPDNIKERNKLFINVDDNNKEDITERKARSKKDILQEPKKIKRQIPQSQINRKQNSLKLINNANLCLFDSLKTRFKCFYCKNSYLNITELRNHTTLHSDPKYLKMCINRLQGMSFKNVDISNLTCKLCSSKLNNLDDLQNHLTQTHNIEFSGSDHMLIPYKLEEGFRCVLCKENFNTYYRLSIHMNSHYSNHVCEICGASYINRLSLRVHVHSIHKEKKCSVCNLTFSNNYSKIKHMRKVHNRSEAKRYCLLCNKTFRYTYLLNEHKIQEHGMKRQLSVCQECGKSFLSAVNLRTHMRAVHLKERNHPCQFCGMSFFTSCDQRRHERTHQDVRLFSCTNCEGRFKSKDSLRRHLKRQHAQLFVSDVG
ncbi:zinc finger protein 14-like [Hyposmocoma kahamanoa]|uniref:zinc finger protein 14-like n=1 Tax=Hyposmocoma kahamanoa TaxID=1477025 RepID=UPI000E6D88A9|nr:zinc finger protein 14-like [Hyposmocoma kahamanoa]